MVLADQYSISAPASKPPDFYENSPVRRRLVKKRLRNRIWILILMSVLCLVLANIIFQALVIKRTQEIKIWQAKLSKLERDCAKLRIEIAGLESFARIQTAAQRDLGMRVAGPDDYLCIIAAPSPPTPPSYETYTTKSVPPDNLWNLLAGWIEGIGETMAQPVQ